MCFVFFICFAMQKQNAVVFVAFGFLVCIFNECRACFTYNLTYSEGILLKSGSSFYQECYCETPTASIRNLKWLDGNGREIQPQKGPDTDPLVYTEWADRSLNLYIPSLGKSLSGTYKCVTDVGGQVYAITHEVVAYDPLIFFNTPESQSIVKGRDSLITCEVKADSDPRIDWIKGHDEEIKNDGKYEITPKGLVIKNVTDGDEAVYRCTVNVAGTGENVDRYIMVDMIIAPEISKLVANPGNQVTAGDNLSLECRARGYPLPQYSWNKTSDTSVETETNETWRWRQEYNKIVFDNITDEDRGTYECIASNDAGQARKQIVIEVLNSPTITAFKNLTVEEGASVNLTCKASGRPRPRIFMMFESEVDENIPYAINVISETEVEFTLMFFKVHRAYQGIYFCNASNEVDYITEEMHMSVLYKPSFVQPMEELWAWEGKNINLSCEHESQPPAYVNWRYLGNGNQMQVADSVLRVTTKHLLRNTILSLSITKNMYGTYECTAKNHLGEAKKTFFVREAFKPNKVKNVTDHEITATSATFTIDAPEVVGPPLIGYTSEYDEGINYNITNIHRNRTWAFGVKYKIDKLKPNTTYFVRFAGINEVGVGEFGNFFEFETPEKSIPEPPLWDSDAEIVEIQSDNKMLKLKSPEHNGDPIDYYAIKYCRKDSVECVEQRISPTNELKLDHLEPNVTYRLELVAHNSVGNSTPAHIEITVPVSVAELTLAQEAQSAEMIIGVSVVVVVICIFLLDAVLFATRRQGMIANCYYRKNKKRKADGLGSRDKKGLLKDNKQSVSNDTLKRPEPAHKEFEYNKTTGIITGKHSSV